MDKEPIKKCLECGARVPNNTSICPNCGHIYQKADSEKKRRIHQSKKTETNIDDMGLLKIYFYLMCILGVIVSFCLYFCEVSDNLFVFAIGVVCATIIVSNVLKYLFKKIYRYIK